MSIVMLPVALVALMFSFLALSVRKAKLRDEAQQRTTLHRRAPRQVSRVAVTEGEDPFMELGFDSIAERVRFR